VLVADGRLQRRERLPHAEPALVRIELSERDGKTLLRLTDAIHGHLATDTDAKLDTGWKEIFAKAFKSYVEQRAKE